MRTTIGTSLGNRRRQFTFPEGLVQRPPYMVIADEFKRGKFKGHVYLKYENEMGRLLIEFLGSERVTLVYFEWRFGDSNGK